MNPDTLITATRAMFLLDVTLSAALEEGSTAEIAQQRADRYSANFAAKLEGQVPPEQAAELTAALRAMLLEAVR